MSLIHSIMKKSYVLYCEDNVFQTETQLFVPLSKYGTPMALKISSKEYQFKHKIYLPPHFYSIQINTALHIYLIEHTSPG